MAYDLEEQEQMAAIKAWWKQYGNLVTWIVIVALAIYAAWAFWGNYQRGQAEKASHMYYEMLNMVHANDNEKVQRIASDIQEKFGGTAYASMGSLVAARLAYDLQEMDVAKSRLKWVADKSSDAGYKSIARIRLSGILLDEKKYDEALAVMKNEFPDAFASLAEDRRGDIYYAQNKLDEARKAYKAALGKAAADDPGKVLIQLKLDDLGGEAAAG